MGIVGERPEKFLKKSENEFHPAWSQKSRIQTSAGAREESTDKKASTLQESQNAQSHMGVFLQSVIRRSTSVSYRKVQATSPIAQQHTHK